MPYKWKKRPLVPRPTYWQPKHAVLLRYVVEHPAATRAKIGAAVGYSREHVSRVMGMSEFQMRFRALLGTKFNRKARRALTSEPK